MPNSFDKGRLEYATLCGVVHTQLPKSLLRGSVAPYILPRKFRCVVTCHQESRVMCLDSRRGVMVWETVQESQGLCASPDESLVAIDMANQVALLSTSTGKLLRTLTLEVFPLVSRGLAFSPDSKYLAMSGYCVVSMVAITTGDVLWSVRSSEEEGSSNQVAFSACGTYVATATSGISVRFAATGEPLWIRGEGEDAVRKLCFSPDGRTLLAIMQKGASPRDAALGRRRAFSYEVVPFNVETGDSPSRSYLGNMPTLSSDGRLLASYLNKNDWGPMPHCSHAAIMATTSDDEEPLRYSGGHIEDCLSLAFAPARTSKIPWIAAWHDSNAVYPDGPVTAPPYIATLYDLTKKRHNPLSEYQSNLLVPCGTISVDGPEPIYPTSSFAPDGSLFAVRAGPDILVFEVPSARLRFSCRCPFDRLLWLDYESTMTAGLSDEFESD